MILDMCTNHDPNRPSAEHGGKPPRPRKKHRRRRETATARPDQDVPYWVPDGKAWQDLPDGIRQAVSRVLTPAYRRFVLDAPGELERSVGLTLVHLMWLEVCDQVRMAEAAADPSSLTAILGDPEAMMGHHLHLAASKFRAAELLVKLRMVREAFEPPPAAALPAPVHAPMPTLYDYPIDIPSAASPQPITAHCEQEGTERTEDGPVSVASVISCSNL